MTIVGHGNLDSTFSTVKGYSIHLNYPLGLDNRVVNNLEPNIKGLQQYGLKVKIKFVT